MEIESFRCNRNNVGEIENKYENSKIESFDSFDEALGRFDWVIFLFLLY